MHPVHCWHWIERARALWRHRQMPHAASLALSALLAWQLATANWAAQPGAGDSRGAPAASGEAPVEADGETPETPAARLARLHLFGEPQAEDDSQAVAVDAPETELDLTLRGVYAPGKGGGLAIVSTGRGPAKVYAVDDTIAGGARITAIFGDRVVLRRGGRPETLRMDTPELPDSAGATGRAPVA